MVEGHSSTPVPRGPSPGGTVSGWLVAVLLILVAGLYMQLSGLWPQKLFDPNAASRPVQARGDLADDEKATIELFQKASQSVVHVTTSAVVQRNRMNPVEIPRGSGSGFIWDQSGYIVTNRHVVRDAISTGGHVRVVLADSTSYPAEIVGTDRSADLAVLKIGAPAGKLTPIPIGSSGDLKVGQKVFAIGSPFSLDQSLTTGIISGLGREIRSESGDPLKDVIQVNAAINPGNSGGPLLDSAARLIGVNTAIVSPTGAFSGIGFAIPVDTVNQVVPLLMRNGSNERPALGVTLLREDQTSALRERGIFKEDGLLIADVWPNSAAQAAGLRGTAESDDGRIVLGDYIVAIDGSPVRNVKSLTDLIAKKKVGDVIKVAVIRKGTPVEIPVTLRPRPEQPEEP